MILYDTGMLDAVGTIVITVFDARFETLREGVAGNQGVSIFVRDQSNKYRRLCVGGSESMYRSMSPFGNA